MAKKQQKSISVVRRIVDRILTIRHLALVRARGAERVSVSELATLLNGLRNHDTGRSENPAEDVFVSNVPTFSGNYLIFNGMLSASAFSLERLVGAVFSHDFPGRGLLWAQCHALLRLGDAIAECCGLSANDQAPHKSIRLFFGDAARIVYRMSGTGTGGATLRDYLERFEPDPSRHGQDLQVVLAHLADIAREVADIPVRLGRDVPSFVT